MHSGPTRPRWKGHGFGLVVCGIRRRASVHVWRGCAQWLTFSVRSGMHLELGDWEGVYEKNKKKKRIYTPQQVRERDSDKKVVLMVSGQSTYYLQWWVVRDLKEE